MNKREMLHVLIDRLMDVEESETTKKLYFSYWQECGLDFHFSEGNGSRELVRPRTWVYFNSPWDKEQQLKNALIDIELIKNTPDVEPKVSLSLTVEKARELGLIA